jgi:hypothetical protein
MNPRLAAHFAVTAGLLACGCASTAPAAATAATVERAQCASSLAEQGDLRSLAAIELLRVEPLYAHVMTGNNNSEERVSGAKLIVRLPDTLSPQRLTRVLQCHSAQSLLGRLDSSPAVPDPFWLPGSWLDIDVKPDGGDFAILVEADTLSKNLALLARANAFAGSNAYPF